MDRENIGEPLLAQAFLFAQDTQVPPEPPLELSVHPANPAGLLLFDLQT